MPVNIFVLTEDNHCRENLKEFAESEGFIFHHYKEIEEAMKASFVIRPHVVIVDLAMGEKVASFIRTLRETSATKETVVIGLTEKDLTMEERIRITDLIEKILRKDGLSPKELLGHLKELELLHPKRAGLLDEITGLFNYRYLQLRLAQECLRARRYKIPLVLSLIDIDHFGHYVNKKGLYYGNIILKKIAELLKKNLRGSDVICRAGDDAFALIFTNTLPESALQISKRFLTMIHEYPFVHEEIQPKGKITVSIGIAEFKGQSPEELLELAEKALWIAKEKGRNRVEMI